MTTDLFFKFNPSKVSKPNETSYTSREAPTPVMKSSFMHSQRSGKARNIKTQESDTMSFSDLKAYYQQESNSSSSIKSSSSRSSYHINIRPDFQYLSQSYRPNEPHLELKQKMDETVMGIFDRLRESRRMLETRKAEKQQIMRKSLYKHKK